MKIPYVRWITLIAVAVWLSLGNTSCSRTPGPVDQRAEAMKLPGASNVFASLAQKDYEGAIAAWAKLRGTAANEEQQAQFSALSEELRGQLAKSSATDPKAAEAFNALRLVMSGR
jgi:hypothetical protein